MGDANLAIGGVTIALRDEGPGIVPETLRKLTFGGKPGIRIAAGAVAYSDPVVLDVPPLGDLSVSIHLPGAVPSTLVTGPGIRSRDQVHCRDPHAIRQRDLHGQCLEPDAGDTPRCRQ